MSEHELGTVDQPCILCEGTIRIDQIIHNSETGETKYVEGESITHKCAFMKEAIAEARNVSTFMRYQ